jgi:hypothetical protein
VSLKFCAREMLAIACAMRTPSIMLASRQPALVSERERMAVYRFGGLEGTLLRLGESGQMSMIG